jgi:uncharacterized protein (DUF2132 family)
MTQPKPQPNNPLHGITLQTIVETLVARYGFEELGRLVPVRCFTHEPSIKSSLTFLRKTEWARLKVERLFIERCLAKGADPINR